MTLLSACAAPRVVNTDGCAWVRPLVLDDDELIIFAANIRELRGITDQINSQNTTRAKRCT